MYDRRQRLTLEFIVLIFTIPLFGLIIKYITLLWHSPIDPISFRTLIGSKVDPEFAKRASIALYGIPPVATFILTITNLVLYYKKVVPLLYGVIIATIQTLGWSTVLGLWSDCHLNKMFGEYPGEFCYTYYLGTTKDDIRGVSVGWIGGIIALVCSIIVTYLFYFVVAVIDLRRAKGSRIR